MRSAVIVCSPCRTSAYVTAPLRFIFDAMPLLLRRHAVTIHVAAVTATLAMLSGIMIIQRGREIADATALLRRRHAAIIYAVAIDYAMPLCETRRRGGY